MSDLSYQASIHVDRDPETLYDLVSDVTRMGEWSPICAACWWDDDGGPRAGGWFTGRNQTPERTWETRSQVVTADRGREFAFEVNHGFVRWSYTFAPADGGPSGGPSSGTVLTETWNFLPKGIAGFHDRYGPDAETQIAERTSAAHRGIPLTLAAIKKTAESG
jgi:hypothetical protein